MNFYRAYGTCTKDSACGVIECKGVTDLRLTLLACHSPPAIQLQVAYQGSTELDRTFTATGAASVAIGDAIHVIKVTLDHLNNAAILLRVSSLKAARSTQSVDSAQEVSEVAIPCLCCKPTRYK